MNGLEQYINYFPYISFDFSVLLDILVRVFAEWYETCTSIGIFFFSEVSSAILALCEWVLGADSGTLEVFRPFVEALFGDFTFVELIGGGGLIVLITITALKVLAVLLDVLKLIN